VGRKTTDGNMLYDIMIYDHAEDKGNVSVILADSGTMKITADKKYMILNLFAGQTHSEMQPRDRQRLTYPARTDHFKKQSIYIVLQGRELERRDENVFRNQNRALRNDQISYFVDSMARDLERQRIDHALMINYISSLTTNVFKLARKDTTPNPEIKLLAYMDIDSIMQKSTMAIRTEIINGAINSSRNNVRAIKQSEEIITDYKRNLNRFGIEWHKKYTFAFACLVFFLIGAPLGAIIRKGGLGAPLVISVVLFIFYWVTSTTGEKFARESVGALWQGVWFATFIFLPAGLFLTYKAANDSVVFNVNLYADFFKRILRLFKKKNKLEQEEKV
jgi:lipopolysaccharide export system permease protein